MTKMRYRNNPLQLAIDNYAKVVNEMKNPFAESQTPTILYKTDPSCERCKIDPYVPHYNCMYSGNAVGHSSAHCTANACY